MKTKFIGLFVLTIIASAFTTSDKKGKIIKVSEFQKYVDTIGLKFIMPPDYKETYVKENKDLWYGFAIKDKNADFEVRYSVWSLQPTVEQFNKCKLDTNCLMVSPNVIYKGRIQSNVLNMTGGQNIEIGAFPPQAVIKEFNADNGGTAFFPFNCGFGKGYKFGQMVYLHKDNVADVIITFMSNDKSMLSDLMEKSFYALTFK
jgi:hypothetical protein